MLPYRAFARSSCVRQKGATEIVDSERKEIVDDNSISMPRITHTVLSCYLPVTMAGALGVETGDVVVTDVVLVEPTDVEVRGKDGIVVFGDEDDVIVALGGEDDVIVAFGGEDVTDVV